MNEGTLKTLEFEKIVEQLADQASSELGKERCLSLNPLGSLEKIEEAQTLTGDALSRLLKNSSVSFYAGESIYASLTRLDKGSIISAGDLLQIARLLENTARIKSYGRRDINDTGEDSLDGYFSLLEPLSNLCSDIRRCILSEDEISDDASANLRSIRRHMKQAADKIHSQLTQMVNNTYRTYLQDAVITMRDGRYCIPVKSEYKNNVPGMIHDQSSSASTFFIEPAAVVNLNNELRELELQEEKEIEVIISALSNDCAQHLFEIRQNLETVAELDFIFAKGKLALAMNATRPLYNTEGKVVLRKARHPLLPKETVVPIDMSLGDTFDLLIITGPNTGGKTVALKTIGLLSLMGQSGLHIPALDRSELPVFSNVFADIGDEQSIEQSLSTFSSHMKRIVTILKEADEHSLCLFDELGAGTDPTEGAALAIAVLNKLHTRQIRTVATTHYSELKIFAIREPGVMIASCEF
ncbi:MAG: endonuclease MutS2, partial [Parasporobacterium sp.]|nr:endonuclease MutS2 [Parasporobacterium sp.]